MNEWTVSSVLNWTTNYFEQSNIESARLEAEILLANVLNCKRLDLNIKNDSVIGKEALETFKGFIKVRKSRKPLSYILGGQEFMGLEFKVNENTLIPRPETEILVEEVLELIKDIKDPVVFDVCTGSGNIAVSIAKLSKAKTVYALDVSNEALAVCWENIASNSLAGKMVMRQGDMFDAVKNESLEGKVDIIVSNPPYIAEVEFSSLAPEIAFEPRLALYGGKDGLDFYKRLAKESKNFLKPGGFVAVELNSNKSKETADIFKNEGYKVIKIKKDYGGLDRVLISQKNKA
jgi:release factor glutamine methyltransferase